MCPIVQNTMSSPKDLHGAAMKNLRAKPTALCDVLWNWWEPNNFWTINCEDFYEHHEGRSYTLWTSYRKGISMTVLLTEMSLGQSEKAHYQVKIKNKMKCGEQLCKVPCVCVCVCPG